MSKILIITNHSYMLYRFRLELIQELMKEHEVLLSMPFVGHEEDFQALGLRCIRTEVDRRGVNPVKDFLLFRTYRRLLESERPDLVLTYSIKPNIYGGLACRMAGIPYCANVQGLGTAFQRKTLARLVTVFYRMALREVRTVFFENQANAEEFRRRGIVPAGKETVLPGAGINLERYPCVPYPENQPPRFLYIGRIMREKGVDELFAAMRRLHGECGAVLDIVGFYDGDDYRKQVEGLTADGVAVFHGFQQDPRPYYAAADCVVLPSYHEGMSNVLLEAAATGRPVITSDIPGCREAVEDGRTGFLCRARDADSLYEQMSRMARVGLIQGFEDGTFRPNTNITRAQACVIVNRALNRKPDEDHLLPVGEMITWPDNTPDDWFYADMQEATNSHDYSWLKVNGETKGMEQWTEKLPQRDWAAFEHAWSTAHSAPGGEVVK